MEQETSLTINQRVYLHQTFLIIKEYGLPFVLFSINQAVEKLGKTTEERLNEVSEVISILNKSKNPIKNNYPFLSICDIAQRRYHLIIENNRCICPFHPGAKNNTSFLLDNENNTFNCFSCGEHGNLIHFVKLMEEKNGRK